jgi:uncharacterized membrane protein
MAGSEPQHLNFWLRAQQRIATRLVVPLALLQGVTGLLLVWRIGFDLLLRGWLITAIVLYLIALGISFGILLPALRLLIPATATPPPAPAPGSAPSGPPPHIVRARERARMGGMVNAVLILVIIFLMVAKPF